MTNQPPESAEGTLALVAGILHLRWMPGSVIGEGDVRAVQEKAAELCYGHPRALLVDLAGIKWIDHAARNILSAWLLPRTAIVGASPADEIMVYFYIARHSAVCPTRYFTRFDEARSWLRAANAPVEGAKTSPEATGDTFSCSVATPNWRRP